MAFLEKSGNPTLNEKVFQKAQPMTHDGSLMTVKGTINKFGIMFLLLLASASFTWKASADGKNIVPWIIGSAIVGLIVVIVLSFRPQWSAILAPIYALIQGVFVGGISAHYNYVFATVAPNIVIQAVGLTFGVVIAMFALFHFKVIKVTQKFKSVLIAATFGIFIFYMLSWVLSFFNVQMPLIHDNTMWGIGFSLIVVVIAALNLLLDFDMIEKGAAMGAPKYMEWYGSFALMVTIVWLYIEMLRLLSKIGSRD